VSILYLSLDLFSLGGIQRYNRYELRALKGLVPDTRIVACSFASRDGVARDFDEHLDVELIGAGQSIFSKLAFAFRAWKKARHHRAQVVICDHVNLAPIAYLYRLLTGTPYWVHVHAIEVWGDVKRSRLIALQRADRTVSGSQFTRRYLEQRYPEMAGRISAAGDVVDCERFRPLPPDEAIRAQLGLPTGPTILTVSRLPDGRSKGHHTVMEAMVRLRDRFPDLTYLVVGDGPSRPWLEDLARAKGLGGSVVFLGKVSDELLPEIYRLCDVFVLVSPVRLEGVPEGEGIPLVVLEAQASGRAAITGNQDGSAESIVDGESGILVRPEAPDELAEALARLLADPALREQMGRAGRAFVEEQYSFPMFASRIGAVLQEVAPALSRGQGTGASHGPAAIR
jgi:phosphatidyl-myo-inositol dimannoside synthase